MSVPGFSQVWTSVEKSKDREPLDGQNKGHGDRNLTNTKMFPFFLLIKMQKDYALVEGSLEVKLPTIWTDEKQSREEAERRERLEERRVEEKE